MAVANECHNTHVVHLLQFLLIHYTCDCYYVDAADQWWLPKSGAALAIAFVWCEWLMNDAGLDCEWCLLIVDDASSIHWFEAENMIDDMGRP